jgi:hypothetical protein
MNREPRFKVSCGDTHFYFRHGRRLKQSEVNAIFSGRIQQWNTELFPGLQLKDERGQLWYPQLIVTLIPIGENNGK